MKDKVKTRKESRGLIANSVSLFQNKAWKNKLKIFREIQTRLSVFGSD